jgi:hypothetical protein
MRILVVVDGGVCRHVFCDKAAEVTIIDIDGGCSDRDDMVRVNNKSISGTKVTDKFIQSWKEDSNESI